MVDADCLLLFDCSVWSWSESVILLCTICFLELLESVTFTKAYNNKKRQNETYKFKYSTVV